MKRIKWEDALDAYDVLDAELDLDSYWTGKIVRQYLEQPHWTFAAGLLAGVALGVLAVLLWKLLA